jgi:hypothetical protein
MDTESFLPNGEIHVARALAWTGYSRDDFSKIAGGADPESFRMDDRLPLWGILYVSRESLGFFVHPGFPTGIAALFYAGKEPAPAIHLRVPLNDVVAAESAGVREAKTRIGKFLARAFLKSESSFLVTWKDRASGSDFRARFFVERDASALAEAAKKALGERGR